jgi:hypothetical protein
MSSESWMRLDQFDRSLAPTIATDRGLNSRVRRSRDRPRGALSVLLVSGTGLSGAVFPGAVFPETGLT